MKNLFTRWWKKFRALFLLHADNREELRDILRMAERRGIIHHEVFSIVNRTLYASDRQVRDIMLSRTEASMLRMEASMAEWVAEIIKSKHSRYPVTSGDLSKPVGILLAKDLMQHVNENGGVEESIDRSALLRPVFLVSETERLNSLLNKFRQQRSHLAIVIDEHGDLAGIVTLEDALEEIIGEIEDEYDDTDSQKITPRGKDHWEVDALIPLREFNEFFGSSIRAETTKIATLSGYISHRLAHLARAGEKVEAQGLELTVRKASRRRVESVTVTRKTPQGE